MRSIARILMGALSLVLVGGASACSGAPANAYMTTPGGGDRFGRGSFDLGQVSLRPDVCANVPENKPDEAQLDERALVDFLQRQGWHCSVVRARPDLVYVDVTDSSGRPSGRLRVAILADAHAADRDLHEALLEHGPGSWGVHRSNLAVLAPIGDLGQILEFAGQTKLACWGVLTVAGRDDDFVVPGGYMEF
jgi:hypothetical protein